MSTSFWSALHMKKSHPAILPCHGTPSCLIFRRLCRAIHVFRRLCLQSHDPKIVPRKQPPVFRVRWYDARAFLQNQVIRRTSEVRSCHVEYEYQKKNARNNRSTLEPHSKQHDFFLQYFFFLLTMAEDFYPETQKMFEISIEVLGFSVASMTQRLNSWIIEPANFLRAILQRKHPKIQREKNWRTTRQKQSKHIETKKLQMFHQFTMDFTLRKKNAGSKVGSHWKPFHGAESETSRPAKNIRMCIE